MKPTSRRNGVAVLLAGALWWAGGTVLAQEGPPPLAPPPDNPVSLEDGLTPLLPPSLPPKATPAPAPKSPTPATPVRVATPVAGPSLPGGPSATPREIGTSIKDIVIEATEGPNQANPTGRQEPGVSIQWVCPSNVRVGVPATCTIVVKSLSANRLHRVVVRSRVPASASVKATEPPAGKEGDILVWELGSLEPREEKRLDLYLVPTARGSIVSHAFVTFTGSSTTRIEAREPKLVLTASAPKRVVNGDPATFVLTVSNPGDAPAEHVKVTATLSDGLEHARGKTIEFNLENLGPNEGRTVLVHCLSKTEGRQTMSVTASAEPKLVCQQSAQVEIVTPRVEVQVTGPRMRFLERQATFTFKVTNPGTAAASHVTLSDVVPPGFKVVSVSGGGRHDFGSRSVVWFLGDVEPGQSREVTLDLVAINPGEYRNRATVTAARGLRAESEALTRVEGLPGLLMELVDVEDPVEVGKDNSFEIRVTNTGTKTETNLQMTCAIPDKMEFRAAKAPPGCTISVKGREVTFSPLSRLAPRADVIYRINVRCLAAGDLRFQAVMKADGLERPVLREESTRVYGDEKDGSVTPPRAN